jgi:GNAT superfamily N-acetyltransferase
VSGTTAPGDPGESVEITQLTAVDRGTLADFSCRGYREPWTDLVEEMVRCHLADALDIDGVSALGLWRDEQLCAVVAWRIDSSSGVCRSILLAVRNGHRRRGYGRRLKAELVDRARRSGAVAVVSEVHWDNDPMIELNAQLGANVEQIEGDTDHCLCVIPL